MPDHLPPDIQKLVDETTPERKAEILEQYHIAESLLQKKNLRVEATPYCFKIRRGETVLFECTDPRELIAFGMGYSAALIGSQL